MVLPDTVPVNRRPVGSMTVVPDSPGSSGSSNTMTTAAGAAPRRAPGAGVEETGTACAEALAGRTSSRAPAARMRPPSRHWTAQPGGRASAQAPHDAGTSVQYESEDAQRDQGQDDGKEDGRMVLRRARLGQPGRVAFPAHRPTIRGRLTAAHALVVRAPLHDRHSLEGHHGPVRRCAPP